MGSMYNIASEGHQLTNPHCAGGGGDEGISLGAA
jgi:hypothetical protein